MSKKICLTLVGDETVGTIIYTGIIVWNKPSNKFCEAYNWTSSDLDKERALTSRFTKFRLCKNELVQSSLCNVYRWRCDGVNIDAAAAAAHSEEKAMPSSNSCCSLSSWYWDTFTSFPWPNLFVSMINLIKKKWVRNRLHDQSDCYCRCVGFCSVQLLSGLRYWCKRKPRKGCLQWRWQSQT